MQKFIFFLILSIVKKLFFQNIKKVVYYTAKNVKYALLNFNQDARLAFSQTTL